LLARRQAIARSNAIGLPGEADGLIITGTATVPELAAGTRVAHYEIVSRIGAGGMGEVYKAYDQTLDRHIALKLLPLGSVPTEDALRRFTREAKAASGLNHPNIITVHEIGQAAVGDASVNYIAMELVEGKTLRDLLGGKFEMEKALLYLGQTAEGLAKAHAAGIVHRDLKPENIMISVDGYAKILDFGLAKANGIESLDPDGKTDVRSERITREGMVMGTVGYMSPEQVRGYAIDSRSDIFSLGCILYETATHRQPFRGNSAVETLHKIAYEPPPPMTDAKPPVTPELERIIRKSLAKDPDERYQSAKEIAIDLRQIRKKYESGGHLSGAVARPALPAKFKARYVWIGAAIVAALIVAFIGIMRTRSWKSDRDRFEAMTVERLRNTSNVRQAVISPDGRTIAHVESGPKGEAILVRQVSSGSEIVAAAADGDPYGELEFSRDGESLRYIHRHALQQSPVLGGPAKRLIDNVTSPVTFAPDGKRCAFVRDGSLYVATFDGKDVRRVAGATKREFYVHPAWSPRNDVIACTKRGVINMISGWIEIIHPANQDSVAEAAGHPTVLGGIWFAITSMQWLPDGSSLVVSAQQRLFSERQLYEISYPDGVIRRITNDLFDYQGASVNGNGTMLVSRQTDKRSSIWLVPRDHPENAKRLIEGVGAVSSVASIPGDGFLYAASSAGSTDIWRSAADGSDRKQLTDDPAVDLAPATSPDGRFIAFLSDRSREFAIWRMDADGSHQMRISSGGWATHPMFSADGKWVYFTSRRSGSPALWKMDVDGNSPTLIATPYSIRASPSPDGRLIAACDDQWKIGVISAANGKLIRAFDGRADAQVRWTKDSRAIAFSHDGAIYLQNIDGGPPRKLADFSPDDISSFDWTADGTSLLCARTSYQPAAVVLRNFR
jgi:eukaryotic-like serine/threonine-protein kinase